MNHPARKLLLSLVVLAALGSHAIAQLIPSPPEPIIGARLPALSPDGQQLAFVYRGDIWLVSSAGGRASALTSHIETDAFPIFSPDARWIAFASKRNGNWDIFAVPVE